MRTQNECSESKTLKINVYSQETGSNGDHLGGRGVDRKILLKWM